MMIPLLAAAALLLMLTATSKSSASTEPSPTVDPSKDAFAELNRIMRTAEYAAEFNKLRTLASQGAGPDRDLFNWVTTLLAPALTNNPVYIYSYAMVAQSKGYPTIAQALSARFYVAVKKIKGVSGRTWFTWTGAAQPDKDGYIAVDVLSDAMPVLSYKLKLTSGAGTANPMGIMSTRRLIAIAPSLAQQVPDESVRNKLIDDARRDFAPAAGGYLSFEGNPN